MKTRIVLGVGLLAFCVWLIPALAFAEEEKTRTIKGWGNVIDPDGDCRINEACAFML
jgi:hypothetical protein